MMGDFNSVETSFDHLSGNLDSTSELLTSLLNSHSLKELDGTHRFSFTYHHPSSCHRKSRLDCIYLNFALPKVRGYSNHVSFSDYYLVGLYYLPDQDKGPGLWRLPHDAL